VKIKNLVNQQKCAKLGRCHDWILAESRDIGIGKLDRFRPLLFSIVPNQRLEATMAKSTIPSRNVILFKFSSECIQTDSQKLCGLGFIIVRMSIDSENVSFLDLRQGNDSTRMHLPMGCLPGFLFV
jgi:hypothetical protein